MDKEYFGNISTLEGLRKQYKELLKKHHPDNGGNLSDMQDINAEYDRMFRLLKDRHDTQHTDTADGDNKESAYSKNMYDWENDKALREILQNIINFDGIGIEIAGQWIWVSGNTYACKKELKEIGFNWASKKKMWYWHSEVFRKKGRKTLSMDDIRNYYGSTKVQAEGKILLMQA